MMLGQLENPKVPPTTQDAIVDILATSLHDLSKTSNFSIRKRQNR